MSLDYCGRHYTFGDLAERADCLAADLVVRGIHAGDRLAIYLPNRVEWIDLYLACLSLGVVVVPINILYRDREVRHIVQDAQPAAIVADAAVPGAGATPIWDVSELSSCALRRTSIDMPGYEAQSLHRGTHLLADTARPPADQPLTADSPTPLRSAGR